VQWEHDDCLLSSSEEALQGGPSRDGLSRAVAFLTNWLKRVGWPVPPTVMDASRKLYSVSFSERRERTQQFPLACGHRANCQSKGLKP
jgi:hypothetical protein